MRVKDLKRFNAKLYLFTTFLIPCLNRQLQSCCMRSVKTFVTNITVFISLNQKTNELFYLQKPCMCNTIVQRNPNRHVFRLGLQNALYYVPDWLNVWYRRVKGSRDQSLPEALRPKTGCSPKQEKPSSTARVVENNMFLFGSNKKEKHIEILKKNGGCKNMILVLGQCVPHWHFSSVLFIRSNN